MKRTLAALAATATCLILAGCGDDGSQASDDSAESKALTRAELIEQGDAICRASNDRMETVIEGEVNEQSTEEEFLALVDSTMIPELKGQSEDLRALEPPAEDAAGYGRMLEALEAGIERVEADPSVALTDDALFSEANKEAQAIGFKECGKEE